MRKTLIAAEAKLALHFPELHLPYPSIWLEMLVLNQRGSECVACRVHVAAHSSHTALTSWDPSCLPGISLPWLPLASRRWSCPEGSGGPGQVSIWRRHWHCRRTQRCAGQESLCSPFLRAWSSLEESSNACHGVEQTHRGGAFCLPTAPAALHAFSLVTGSSVPCCSAMVPALLGAPVCSMALAKLLPPSVLPGDFI